MKYCIHCGSKIDDSAGYCATCGKSSGKRKYSIQPDGFFKALSSKVSRKYIYIGIAILVLASVLIAVFPKNNQQNDNHAIKNLNEMSTDKLLNIAVQQFKDYNKNKTDFSRDSLTKWNTAKEKSDNKSALDWPEVEKIIEEYKSKLSKYVSESVLSESIEVFSTQLTDPNSNINFILADQLEEEKFEDSTLILNTEDKLIISCDYISPASEEGIEYEYKKIYYLTFVKGDNLLLDHIYFTADYSDDSGEQKTFKELGNDSINIANAGYVANDNDLHFISLPTYRGIYAVNYETKKSIIINENHNAEYLNATEGWLYYLNSNDEHIYKMKYDGTELSELNKESSSYVSVYDGWIYFINKNDNCIYKMLTNGECIIKISSDSVNSIALGSGWIYYTNADDNSSIYKISIYGDGRAKLNNKPSEKVSCIDQYENSKQSQLIFYINSDDLKLYRMKDNGTDEEVIYNEQVHTYNFFGVMYIYLQKKDFPWVSNIWFSGEELDAFPDLRGEYLNYQVEASSIFGNGSYMYILLYDSDNRVDVLYLVDPITLNMSKIM